MTKISKKCLEIEDVIKLLKDAHTNLQELHIKPHRYSLREADIDTYPPPAWDVTIIDLDRNLKRA